MSKVKQTTLKDVREALKPLGGKASIQKGNYYQTVYVSAPKGRVWKANGYHHISHTWPAGNNRWKSLALDAAINMIKQGFKDVED